MSAEAAVRRREDWQSLEDHFPKRSLASDRLVLAVGRRPQFHAKWTPPQRSHTVSFPQHPIGYTGWPCSVWEGATKPSSEGPWVSSWRLVATLYIGSMADEVPGAGNFQNPSKNVFFLNPQSEAFKICPAILGTWERSRGLSQRGQNSKTNLILPLLNISPQLFLTMFLFMWILPIFKCTNFLGIHLLSFE